MKITIFLLSIMLLSCGMDKINLNSNSEANINPPTGIHNSSEWELRYNIVADKIFFEWNNNPNVFLYEKENCGYCQFEMYPESLVTYDVNNYYSWDFENSKWFGRKTYTLKETFSYTVKWDFKDFPGYIVDTYQVFFYGSRGYSYHHNVGVTNSFTFAHLDPTKLPWTFTVYALIKHPGDTYPSWQMEIKKIIITTKNGY